MMGSWSRPACIDIRSNLDAKSVIQARVSERYFDQFFDDLHLLGAATDVVVADPFRRPIVLLP